MKLFDHVDVIKDPIDMKTKNIDGRRYYVTPSGGKYPSITTVISNNSRKQAGLARWRNRVGKDKAQAITTRSASRGTRFHLLTEDYINNVLDLDKYKDQPLPVAMFHSARSTLDNINKVYLQEAALYSDYLELAGRVDCIAEYNNELAVIDFKTAAKPKKEEHLYDYYVQETGYACMLQELYGISVKKLVTILVCENGDVQVSSVPPKKEYLVRLQEYIAEYKEKNERHSGG